MTGIADEPKMAAGKVSAMWVAILTTLAALVLVPMGFFHAAFTLWGIGEINYPRPFMQDPMEWVENFLAIGLPIVALAVTLAVWITYSRGRYQRMKIWAIGGLIWTLAWIPGWLSFVNY